MIKKCEKNIQNYRKDNKNNINNKSTINKSKIKKGKKGKKKKQQLIQQLSYIIQINPDFIWRIFLGFVKNIMIKLNFCMK